MIDTYDRKLFAPVIIISGYVIIIPIRRVSNFIFVNI